MLIPLLLSLTMDAHAFCGTYVGEAGATLYNHASQLVYVRQGTTNTLTLANDFTGDVTNFALLIPVPEVLEREDVSTVDPALLTELDRYSGPRLVSYTCENLAMPTAMSCGGEAPKTSGAGGEDSGLEKAVTVEAAFTVGVYSIVVLSARESGALLDWLGDNGYAVSANAEALLQEYIDAGTYFVAARVTLEQLPIDGDFLSPLRIRYDSAAMTLPIRLGTLNSDGVQDFMLYTFTDVSGGEVHIANYPEIVVEDECMLPEGEDADFGGSWAAKVDAAFGEQAGWILEYAWSPSSCDPCPDGGALAPETLDALGYEGDATNAFFTRLHMRYRPEQVTEDLVLYESGVWSTSQIRYITYKHELESSFPICGVGMVPAEEAGTCAEVATDSASPAAEPEGGCASARTPRGLWAGMLAFVGLTLLLRRR